MNNYTTPIASSESTTLDFTSKLQKNAHWLLRIALASVFIFHGISKLLMLEQTAKMLAMSSSITLLVALAEALGGLALIIGPFTHKMISKLGALAIIPVMFGAIIMVHWGRWSFTPAENYPMGGMEFQVVLILLAGYFLIKKDD